MKKLLLFTFSVALLSGAAMAQTAKQEEKKDLRETIKDKKMHQKAVVKNAAHLDLKAAKVQHEKAELARKQQHAIAKDLKAKGEKQPVHKAKKIIHAQHEAAEKKAGN